MPGSDEKKYHLDHMAHAEFILDRIEEGVMVLDVEFKILSVNKYLLELVGSNEDHAIGNKCHEVFFASDDPCSGCPVAISIETGEPASNVHKCEMAKKKGMYVSHRAFPVVDPDGRVEVVIETVRDISEMMGYRRKLEEHTTLLEEEVVRRTGELKESEDRYRSLFENSLEGIGLSKGGQVISANQALLDIFGYDSLEDFLEVPILDRVAPESMAYIEERMKARTQGKAMDPRFEYKIVRPDGELRDLAASSSPVVISGEEYVLTTFRDITERKRAEDTEASFGRILESSLNEIYIFDAETFNFIQVNRGARENLGYTMDELAALTPTDIKPEFTKERFLEVVEPLRSGERNTIVFETIHLRKDNSEYPVEVHLQFSTYKEKPVFVAIILDITNRKKAEETLKASERKFRDLFDSATDGIFILDMKGNFLDINRTAHERLGYTKEEMMALHISELDPPEFAPRVPGRLKQIQDEGQAVFESAHYRKDGTL